LSSTKPVARAIDASDAMSPSTDDMQFMTGVARAFGGALLFALPLLMTMEMWGLGFSMAPSRLAVLLVVTVPLLVGLSHYIGFEETFDWKDDVVDAFVAYGVGFAAAVPVLFLFGVLAPGMSAAEIVGKTALQAVPGSIGALLAQSQFGGGRNKSRRHRMSYGGETFVMAAGAIYLSLNVAPTEEVLLIALQMNPWHALGLVAVSLVLMHAFVYALGFSGGLRAAPHHARWLTFVRFTVAGYGICLLISGYILWTFERTSGTSVPQAVMAIVVLSFPAAIGAASARLVL
jgi:putative integral membrane protein (TIGR02587 family)